MRHVLGLVDPVFNSVLGLTHHVADLAGIDPAHADHVAAIINSQRRRSLNYQSPTTIYHALTVQ